MKLFTIKTLLEVVNQIFINLSAGWLGVILISPGFFGVSSQEQYFQLLIKNLPFAIVGIVLCSALAERVKHYER